MGRGRPIQARPVDMGLPSGLQWANCNIGAESPVDEGLFFSWGNIEGHAMGEEYYFSQSEYDSTPGAEIQTNLPLENDAARANLGAPWRMPTEAEFIELYNNCTCVFTTLNGVNGQLFTSNVNGNKLFFPAAGRCKDTTIVNKNNGGYYWSSTYYSATTGRSMNFTRTDVIPQNSGSRYNGFSVRAVLQPT